MTKPIPLSRAAAQVAAVLGACLLAFACPAAAFTPSTSSPKVGGENTPLNLNPSSSASHSTSSGGASIVRTIVGLAIVIAVIWGLSWILRQVKAGRGGGGDSHQSSGGLASVAALTLSSGRSLHLVRAGSDYVLLGSAEHGLVPIHRYTEEQARDAGLLLEEPVVPARRLPSAREIITRQLTPPDATSGRVIVGQRPDPMRMSSSGSGLIERVREWTVRR